MLIMQLTDEGRWNPMNGVQSLKLGIRFNRFYSRDFSNKRANSSVFLVMLLVCGTSLASHAGVLESFGGKPKGARLQRMEASPQWLDGNFINPQPLRNSLWGMVSEGLHASDFRRPKVPLPIDTTTLRKLRSPPVSGLRATWFGHSTSLIEIDGKNFLLDPIFSERASPVDWAGPQRWFPPGIPLQSLPRLDAVLVSHDHYDHLDMKTIKALVEWTALFVVPLGVGAHLEAWGVPSEKIQEMDWWETIKLGEGEFSIVCTPARHASGRKLIDQDGTLWAGYALIGKKHRVYYSGDTGLFPAMREIGDRLGPFDLTLIEIGQYAQSWPDWHIGPEQAVLAHQWVKGKVFLPVHWGAFVLAYHSWTEPIERVRAEATKASIRWVAPRPEEAFEPGVVLENAPEIKQWWPDVEWRRVREYPIHSSQVGHPEGHEH
jgi:L-ascorbate metabolism protein UlaG (beta-lactamase superfamily)